MKNLKYTENMYNYLALRLLQKIFGEVEWVGEDAKQIDNLACKAGGKLTDEQRKIVENRVIRINNEYEKLALEDFEQDYLDEYGEDDDFFFTPIDYNEKFYEIWKQGVAKRQTVKMKYDSTTSGISERLVDPYKSRTPYGEGYCHSRKELRKFRFDRVIDLELTDSKFEK